MVVERSSPLYYRHFHTHVQLQVLVVVLLILLPTDVASDMADTNQIVRQIRVPAISVLEEILNAATTGIYRDDQEEENCRVSVSKNYTVDQVCMLCVSSLPY
jgi:hypothetical protein